MRNASTKLVIFAIFRFMHSKDSLRSIYDQSEDASLNNVHVFVTPEDDKKLKHIYGR